MKIQINSLAALERLIGEDKDMEIAVKESVLNQFAHKTLKAVLNSDVARTLRKIIEREIDIPKVLAEYVNSTTSSYVSTHVATDRLKGIIRKEIDQQLGNLLRDEIHNAIAEMMPKVDSAVNEAVAYCCTRVSEANIDRLVRERLQKMIKEA